MRLANFIHSHHELILTEWESFARTLLPGAKGMSSTALRDHADEILTALVQDMESSQSGLEEVAKSKGGKASGRLGALGQLHAAIRMESGFTLPQMLSEYRALRASVLRLWGRTHADPEGVLRFNEAIDEAISEAVTSFTNTTNQYRDEVIAIVSHDLRNPLGAVLAGSSLLLSAGRVDDKSARIAARIHESAKRMTRMVDDLLNLTRARLGCEMPIVRSPTDVGLTCQTVIAELQGSHPSAVIRYGAKGDLRGEWDADRLAQVVSNLVANALQHGDPDQPISVDARDDGEEVVLTVHNEGPPIPASALTHIFEPFTRYRNHSERAAGGLGLGLYITKQLVMAHGGEIQASSTRADGTTFTVRLPRLRVEERSRVPPDANGRLISSPS